MQEVVDMSPSLTSDGAVVLGTRQTTVTLVDPVSGRVIRSFGQEGNSSNTLAAPGVHYLTSGHVACSPRLGIQLAERQLRLVSVHQMYLLCVHSALPCQQAGV